MNTYDAMDSLKRLRINCSEVMGKYEPSPTGTPISPAAAYKQRNVSHGESAGGEAPKQESPPATCTPELSEDLTKWEKLFLFVGAPLLTVVALVAMFLAYLA